MSPGASSSTVALSALLNPSAPTVPTLAGGLGVSRATRRRRLRRLLSALGDAGGILAIPYLFALVILAVGIPIALTVRVLAWLAGALD